MNHPTSSPLRCLPRSSIIVIALGLSVLNCGSSGGNTGDPGATCTAKFCGDFGANCGEIPDDGCGTPLSCGTCSPNQQCGNAKFTNVCVNRECLPTTCQERKKDCGEVDNGCGVPMQCGSCASGSTCGGKGVPNVCGAGTCTPVTCAGLGANCGVVSDGCSKTLQCGDCKAGETCGGGGKSNVCGAGTCVPKTCGQLGANCGSTDNGCGAAMDCGACTAPQTCGGGGTANVCGGGNTCVPKTCQAQGKNCGSMDNGCGTAMECGACTAPQTCGGGGTANVCGGGSTCVPKTCQAEGKNCGDLDTGCGSTAPCGTCTSPQTCGGGGVALVCGKSVPTTWKAISAGSFHTCGIRTDDSMWCWGNNDSGQLGNGTSVSSALPVPVSSAEAWSSVAAGGLHTCALTTQGKMYCWGNNDEGQVGDLTFASRNVPTITEPSVEDPSVPWEEVQSGVNHTCARKGWYVYCFGSNSRGQLALGDYDSRNKPTQVTLSGILSVGSYHTCLIKSSAVNDTVLCAGANDYAQLGASTPMDSPVFLGPKAPTSFPTWQYVEAGGRHTCAGYLNNLYCWGSNDSGQLGNPTSSAVGPTPQAISYYLYGFNWVSVIAGDSHTCAIQEPDKLFCWGANDAGQLGIGSNQQKADAVEIGVGWKSVSLGFSHSCGIKNDATLWCWGDNTEGQIGTGTGSVNFPTQIQ